MQIHILEEAGQRLQPPLTTPSSAREAENSPYASRQADRALYTFAGWTLDETVRDLWSRWATGRPDVV